MPCVSFGTLRRPRVRSRRIPYGFNPKDPFTQLHNMLARRPAFVLCIAVRRGQYVSVEQQETAFRCLRQLRRRQLFGVPERCIPQRSTILRIEPVAGQSVASCSGAYPLGLVDRMASGSTHALEGFRSVIAPQHHAFTEKLLVVAPSSSWPLWFADEEPFEPRSDHEDPEWVKELCQNLNFREVFRYHFKRPGRINGHESRIFKSWMKSFARKTSSTHCVGLLDSRVAIGAAARGRSSSFI